MECYRRAFDPIQMPPDLCDRILARAEESKPCSQPNGRKRLVIQLTALAACAVLAISIVTVGRLANHPGSPGGDVTLVNPNQEMSLKELEAVLPFPLQVPKESQGYELEYAGTLAETMAQLIYQKGDAKFTYRMAQGDGDISGDYNQYSEMTQETVGALTVTLKGADGVVSLAVWTAEGYTYSLSFTPGLDREGALDIIESIE